MKEFHAKLTDADGIEWLFEGCIKGQPIWTPINFAVPRKKFTKSEALRVAKRHAMPGDVPSVQLVQ